MEDYTNLLIYKLNLPLGLKLLAKATTEQVAKLDENIYDLIYFSGEGIITL